MGRLQISKAALEDLKEIGRYTQRIHGPAQRRKYLDVINERLQLLLEMPHIAGERKEFTPPVRIFRQSHHYIVYIANSDGVYVLRILHVSMDIDTALASKS